MQINFAQPAEVLHNFIRGNDKVSANNTQIKTIMHKSSQFHVLVFFKSISCQIHRYMYTYAVSTIQLKVITN